MAELRDIVVILHLVGFALLFGAWAVEAIQRRVQVTRIMQWGMTAALATGLALAVPWGREHDLNYVKLGVKLAVLVVIAALLGIGGARQRRGRPVAPSLFWAVGILTLVDVAIAVLV